MTTQAQTYKFALGEKVSILVSGQVGTVAGQASYIQANASYLVRYKDADGDAESRWFSEEELSLTPVGAEFPDVA